MIRHLRALPLLLAAIPAPLFANTPNSWLLPASGDWSNPANWSAGLPNNAPGTNYDVSISATGAPYTVSLGSANTTSISSLTLGAAQTSFDLDSPATLSLAGPIDLANSTFNLTGTVALATIQSSGAGQLWVQPHVGTAATTLTGVTLAATAFIQPGATLYVSNNLTLSNSAIHLQGNAATPATVNFLVQDSGNSIHGNGTVIFDGSDNANFISLGGSVPVGVTVQTGPTGGTISNLAGTQNGTLSAQTANATLTLSSTQSMSTSNTSLLQAINGSQLVIINTAFIGGILNVDANSSVTITGSFSESSQFGTATLHGTGTINAQRISGTFKILTNTVHITGTGLNTVTGLTIGGSTDHWTGKLDIGNADLRSGTANGQPDLATLQNQLKNGAILSSNLTPSTAVALFSGPDYTAATGNTKFDGQTVTGFDNLLKLALLGDTNLDNKVDLSDLNTVLNNFGQPSLSWTHGNFDYAPTIDLTDLADVLNNFGTTALTPTDLPPTPAPEPTSLLLLTLATPTLLKRRR